MPDGSLLVVSMTTTGSCAGRRAASVGARRRQRALRRAPQRHGRRRARPRLRRQLRLRPDGRRRPAPATSIRVDPDGSARSPPRTCCSPTAWSSPPTAHADRRRDGGRPLHRLHDRRRRLVDRPADLGPGRADAGARRLDRDAAGARVRPRWLRARCRGPHLGGRRGRRPLRRLAPGGEIVDEIARPRAWTSSPACSAATTGARCSSARRPTSSRRRAAPPEAVLLTATVDVPHAGLPPADVARLAPAPAMGAGALATALRTGSDQNGQFPGFGGRHVGLTPCLSPRYVTRTTTGLCPSLRARWTWPGCSVKPCPAE